MKFFVHYNDFSNFLETLYRESERFSGKTLNAGDFQKMGGSSLLEIYSSSIWGRIVWREFSKRYKFRDFAFYRMTIIKSLANKQFPEQTKLWQM